MFNEYKISPKSGNPMALFESFSEWGSKTKYAFWPSQVALLLLAPDVLSKLGTNADSSVVRKTERKFCLHFFKFFVCFF